MRTTVIGAYLSSSHFLVMSSEAKTRHLSTKTSIKPFKQIHPKNHIPAIALPQSIRTKSIKKKKNKKNSQVKYLKTKYCLVLSYILNKIAAVFKPDGMLCPEE